MLITGPIGRPASGLARWEHWQQLWKNLSLSFILSRVFQSQPHPSNTLNLLAWKWAKPDNGAFVVEAVFPSVQSVLFSPRAGRTPVWRPLPGTDAQWQSVLIYARDGRPGPIGVLDYVPFLNLMSIRSVLWGSDFFFYSNVEKIRLYYHVSNFAINKPMLLVISDLGLYLCIFCSLRLRCGATTEPMGDGLPFPKRLQGPAVNLQDCGV